MIVYADALDDFLFKINAQIINPVIEFAFLVAFVVFLYGVLQFIRGADDVTKRTEGKEHMMWGIIGFVIMLGVFGIINILVSTFGIKGVNINQDQQTFDPSKQNIQNLKDIGN